jgi:hypothetical protein
MCDLSLQVFLQENNGLCKKKEEKKIYGHKKVQVLKTKKNMDT